MFQSRLPPAVNEISDYFDIVFFPRFKTFAIVENKSVVLQWDELVVDASLAWLIVRNGLWTIWVAVLVEASCPAHRFFHSECMVDQRWLTDASLLKVCRQHWPENGASNIPFLPPKFETLGVSSSRMALYDCSDSPRTLPKYFGSGRPELKGFARRDRLLSLLIYELNLDTYFSCCIPRKVDNNPDILVKLVVFYACEVEFMSDQGENGIIVVTLSIACTIHTEHVIQVENDVFILGLHPKPCLVPHMQGKCILMRKFTTTNKKNQLRICVGIKYTHGRRKCSSPTLSCFMFHWRMRQLTDLYFSRLYIRSRLAEIDSDTYWIYSAGLMILRNDKNWVP